MELFECAVAVVLCALMTEREVERSFWKKTLRDLHLGP